MQAKIEAEKAKTQLGIFLEHSQLSQSKIDDLTTQIEGLQERLRTLSAPEKVEIIPPSVLDEIQSMKSQITNLTEQKKLLSDEAEKLAKNLTDLRQANEAQHKQELYEARIKDKWNKSTDTLYKSLSQFVGQLPSSMDLQLFGNEEWAGYTRIEKAFDHALSLHRQLKQAYNQVIDDTADEISEIVYGQNEISIL